MGMIKHFAEAVSEAIGKDGAIDDDVAHVAGTLLSFQEELGLIVTVEPNGIFIGKEKEQPSLIMDYGTGDEQLEAFSED